MIKILNKFVSVTFGKGTVRVTAQKLKTVESHQLVLTQCKVNPIGDEVSKSDDIVKTNKIVLNFTSVKSLDVVIEKLEFLRKTMVK